jgi:hypothetical protein
MSCKKIIRRSLLMAAATVILVATSWTIIADGSDCMLCVRGGSITGKVKRINGDPPDPNGVTVYFECKSGTGCSSAANWECLIDDPNGNYGAWLGIGDCDPMNESRGIWRIFALGHDNDCVVSSDTVEVDWRLGGHETADDLTLVHIGDCW